MGVDKLVVLGRHIAKRLDRLALDQGRPGHGYRRYVDLRQTEVNLPVVLHHSGKHTGIHKVELVGVARLGLSKTNAILREIFPHIYSVKIFRIDLCVDILGRSVWDIAQNWYLPRVQNFRLYRTRTGDSFYLQASGRRSIVIYDRGKLLRKKHDRLANILRANDRLTRIEFQLKGALPFKRLQDIGGYAKIDFFADLRFAELVVHPDTSKPMQFLAEGGLRTLVEKYGLQGTAKMFAPPEWAYVRNRFLRPMQKTDLSNIQDRLRRSIEDWLKDRIRFPR